MKNLLLLAVVCMLSGSFFAQAKVNLESAEEITHWVESNTFKTDETLGYSLSVETVNGLPVLFFGSNTGVKKEYPQLNYVAGTTAARVLAQGSAGNTIEIMVLENGDLMLSGMLFKAVK